MHKIKKHSTYMKDSSCCSLKYLSITKLEEQYCLSKSNSYKA